MHAVYALFQPTLRHNLARAMNKPGTAPLVMKHGGAVAAWSDPATWGGRLPAAGDSVIIPPGRRVLLDVSPPALKSLQVDGLLIFDDADLNLSAGWISVGGEFRIGAPGRPFTRQAVITLTGSAPGDDLPRLGTKYLAADGGLIDLHGEWRDTRVKLAASAEPGASEILLARLPGWRPGERLLLGAADLAPQDAEVREITAVNRNLIALNQPLSQGYWGGLQTRAGRPVDQRAEARLLSRNIRLQGEARPGDPLGGCLLILPGGRARLSGVEISGFGQPGREPIHLHPDAGADAVRLAGCSLHHNIRNGASRLWPDRRVLQQNVVYDWR